MSVSGEKWTLARETVGDGRLSVITGRGGSAAVRSVFAAHGLSAEIVETDQKNYQSRAAALLEAFDRTHGEFVFVVDTDFAANAERLPRFFGEMLTKGADVVIGSKRHPESNVAYPIGRRFSSWAYYAFVRMFLGLKITDTQTGVKLVRRETLRYALERMLSKSGAFDLELLTIAAGHGAKIVEAPVTLGTGRAGFRMAARSFVRQTAVDTLAVFYRARVLGYYGKCLVPKRLDREPKVSIVIACPGGSWMLDECLSAIARQTYRNFETIVLPDGDLTLPPEVRVLPTGKVRPAEKRNLGIREAKGEIVAFIDDDAYPDPHWLEYAVKYFGEPSIGGVGGPGVTPPGDSFLARIGGRVYDNALVSGNYRYRYKAGGVRMDVEDYPSCNLFVRKDVLERIHGYRTDFWPGEDTLLCKDIIDNWKRIIYDPWVVVYHHRRPLLGPHVRQLGRYAFHRGYFCKRYPSNSLRPSYFIPTLFVAYCISWLPLAVFLLGMEWQLNAWTCALVSAYVSIPMGLYVGLVLLSTAAFNPVVWLLTAAGVVATHVTYGVCFAQGILAHRAPCEYIGRDHGSARG